MYILIDRNPSRHGEAYSLAEEEKLRKYASQGYSVIEIAQLVSRKPLAIATKLFRLGLLEEINKPPFYKWKQSGKAIMTKVRWQQLMRDKDFVVIHKVDYTRYIAICRSIANG